MAFSINLVLLFCSLIVVALGNFDDGRENSNDACFEEIRTLRQEMEILRQELKIQGEEIKRLQKGVPRKSDKNRDSVKGDHLSTKANRTQYESFRTDSISSDVKSQQEKRFRQGRLLMPTNPSSTDNTPRIAFYANTVKDHVNLGVHHTLIFGNDVTNEGNLYHHSTGNFIPNVSGVYVFHVQIILCSPGHDLRTELVVEGVIKAAHYTGGSTNCSNGGGMAIVHVNAGDSVWVRVRTSDGGNDIAWESSFAGFLLYPQ